MDLLLLLLFPKVQVGPCINHTFGGICASEVNLIQNDLIWKSENESGSYSERTPMRGGGSGRVGPTDMRTEGKVTGARQRPGVLHHPKSCNGYLISCSPVKKLPKEPDTYRRTPDWCIVGDQLNVWIIKFL